MKPEFNYTKEFTPYLGYDKFEYDLETKDGVFKNYYPNAGSFVCLRNPKAPAILEEDILNIRYSETPITTFNWVVDPEGIKAFSDSATYLYERHRPLFPSEWIEKPLKNKVPVRTEPKIKRNDPCPCGCGKKFKNCK